MRLLDLFRPRLRRRSVFDIDLEALRAQGIRGLILDLDNTLLPHGSREVTDAVLVWMRRVREAGLGAVLVTNSRARRVTTVAERLGIPVARGFIKPAVSMLRQAMALMGTGPAETAMIGDQLLTDMLAGNRLGLYTILVTPLSPRELPTTRYLSRRVERWLLRLLDLPPAESER
ncbi:MAG: YqeG family HAD IIIA-type phosphatase [Armatimonadota bacterium]|nr:YqeG family HAD IIIA-type phosphatase [Armatimonadota bacterium]MDR7450101.1 YqeG family HAD IIIA-type phosphatase [Armatimonadota bacterium]MDR7460730.1 YqeG family HAD IIIA-type phosphatase [Armatimonadota bacterium]MDR7479843.1 YqeG family HAD IIIA-type phosphatase [Armatimonadota bacterium]MDR7490321.1 YqeG family HAD IIIA-type phosphatase [Armatimonadota bacterium]